MKVIKLFLALSSVFFFSSIIEAKENPTGKTNRVNKTARTAAVCAPSTSSAQLDINNVRTLLHNGGDMWWDLVSNPRYEVPKGSGKHSSFAASLWIGGLDASGQLRIASQTYRQSGNDFYPGPLRISPGQTYGPASTDDQICLLWDKHYTVLRSEINAFRSDVASGNTPTAAQYPSIFAWPGTQSDPDFATYMAPFVDADGNGVYNPAGGDYPKVDGDQAIWWVVNDKGNIHSETGGEQIGLEIQVLAFSFSTSNALNDMTFYKQVVYNRSTLTLNNTYLGQWADVDLGYYADDYVGCDTIRGLGYAYNGDANDETATGYGLNPPALGVDFFQGPLADPNDGVDNNKNGIIDEPNERWSMSRFVYYDNDFSLYGNPTSPTHYYGYLTGKWKDGSPMVNDGLRGRGSAATFPITNYLFPGWPGGCRVETGWTEKTAGNQPYDRRFLISAGPFTLQPGIKNEIVIGVIWARDFVYDELGSLCKLIVADDIAQALFDNDFKVLAGPDAPDLQIAEYDKELVLTWDYSKLGTISNNYYENYSDVDPVLKPLPNVDSLFEFQGYMVYQLYDKTVSATELTNPDRARLLFQCDIKDKISTIVNTTESFIGGMPVRVDQVMVQGKNEGLSHSFRATEDLFAEGDNKKLTNYRKYYYAIIAYAYNDTSVDGKLFLQGNNNYKIYSAVPHMINFENHGTTVQSSYGSGVEITRTMGNGNGGVSIELKDELADQIIAGQAPTPFTYKPGAAPILVKVVNPKEVKNQDYRIDIINQFWKYDNAKAYYIDWKMYTRTPNSTSWDTIFTSYYVKDSVTGLNLPDSLNGVEKVIPGHGLSVAIKNVNIPGIPDKDNNGLLSATMSFSDSRKQWLTGVADNGTKDADPFNWISSEEAGRGNGGQVAPIFQSNYAYDPHKDYEKMLGGTWAPYIMTRTFDNNTGILGPRIKYGALSGNDITPVNQAVTLNKLPNVDIVITSDKTKWSKCLVVESSPSKNLGNGGAGGSRPMSARWAKSKNQDGGEVGGILSAATQGYSYFPGYAINVDNGKRLNILFAEASWYVSEHGNDMLWNPTANYGSDMKAAGGRHYIYVTDEEYDGCERYRSNMCIEDKDQTISQATGISGFPSPYNNVRLDSLHNHIAWVTIPMLSSSEFAFDSYDKIPCDVKISLRVTRPFTINGTSYEFNTGKVYALTGQKEIAKKNIMDNIRVVPNPYYGRSGVGKGRYETSQVDSRIKITNLPQTCTIRIFSLGGQLVRTYKKDNDNPDQEWDLKNGYGVPVASGVYIIQVDAGDLGTKVLKFFGVMPEIDLNSY